MDTTKTATHVSLCAGYGGIDLGLKRAIPSLRTIAFSEIEAFACANLVSKMEAGHLDPAPIWTDVKTFPYASFHGKVDILSGGYPCQPFSAAGKRLGAEDPRHLWPFIADGVAAMRPEWCFFENVEGHISLGLPNVIEDLAGMGYRTAWGIFSASEVGAPHQRKRVFILAHRVCERGQLPHWWRFPAKQMPVRDGETRRDGLAFSVKPGSQGGTSESLHTGGVQCQIGRGSHFAWPSRPGHPQFGWEPPRVVGKEPADLGNSESERTGGLPIGTGAAQPRPAGAGGSGPAMGDAKGQRPGTLGAESAGQQRQASASSTGDAMGNADHGRLASGLNAGSGAEADRGGQGDIEQAESGQTQPALGRDADGPAGGMDYAELQVSCDNRTDELRLLGNGVVPATAERAFTTLLQRLLTYA